MNIDSTENINLEYVWNSSRHIMDDSGVPEEQIEDYKRVFYMGAATMSGLIEAVFFNEAMRSKALVFTFYRIVRYTDSYCRKSLKNVYIDEKEFRKFKLLSKKRVKKDTLRTFWFRVRTIKFHGVSPEASHKYKVFFLTGALALHDFLIECFKNGVSDEYIRQEFYRVHNKFVSMAEKSASQGLENA